MKCLVIGIDGADNRVLKKFKLPFIESYISKNLSLDLNEDVWSRGWAKIVTGKAGDQSGGFYAKPRLDGSHLTTSAFSMDNYKDVDCKPLWEKLNKANFTTGFMNVPTTGPATKVNGFMVAGAGGGSDNDGKDTVPEEACYPSDLAEYLNERDYTLDVRFSRIVGNVSHQDFVMQLIAMQEKQTECFIDLINSKELDFGFIALTPLVRAQNIYMKHIDNINIDMEYDPNSVEGYLKKLYVSFDVCLERIINAASAEHVILTSDHGQSSQKFTSNLNIWLTENGFSKTKSKKINGPLNFIKRFTPSIIKKLIAKNSTSLKDYLSPVNLDWDSTDAFSVRYIPGIYLNDKSRFMGRKTDHELQEISKRIISKFNQSDLNKKYGMIAENYRVNKAGAKHERLLPDIWIHHSEDIFPAAAGQNSIQENPNYKYIDDLSSVTHDMYAGSKGIKPFVVCSDSLKEHCETLEEGDLTAVNSLILKSFGLIN
jgi:predicted AlkP superfamily phosphohydrolase/phosphomutase